MGDLLLTFGAFMCIHLGEQIRGGEYLSLRGWIGVGCFIVAVLLARARRGTWRGANETRRSVV